MAARDKREDAGDQAGGKGDRDRSPLDHHLGHREELTPLRPGDEAGAEEEPGERD